MYDSPSIRLASYLWSTLQIFTQLTSLHAEQTLIFTLHHAHKHQQILLCNYKYDTHTCQLIIPLWLARQQNHLAIYMYMYRVYKPTYMYYMQCTVHVVTAKADLCIHSTLVHHCYCKHCALFVFLISTSLGLVSACILTFTPHACTEHEIGPGHNVRYRLGPMAQIVSYMHFNPCIVRNFFNTMHILVACEVQFRCMHNTLFTATLSME